MDGTEVVCRLPPDALHWPSPAVGVVDTIAEYGFALLHIGAAEHMDKISWRVHSFPNPNANAHGGLGIFITLLGGAIFE